MLKPCRAAWEWEFYRRLGANIVAARKAKGWTGADLARAIDNDPATVWYWEQGTRGMGTARLQVVADALGVAATQLLPKISDIVIPL